MNTTQTIDYVKFVTHVAARFAQNVLIPVIYAPVNAGLIGNETLAGAQAMGAPKLDLPDCGILSRSATAARLEVVERQNTATGLSVLEQFAQDAGSVASTARSNLESVRSWKTPILRSSPMCTTGETMIASAVGGVAITAYDAANTLFRAVGLAHTLLCEDVAITRSADSDGIVGPTDEGRVSPAVAGIMGVALALVRYASNPGDVCRNFGDTLLEAWRHAGGRVDGLALPGINTLAVRVSSRTSLRIGEAYVALAPAPEFPHGLASCLQAALVFAANNPGKPLPDFMVVDMRRDELEAQRKAILALDPVSPEHAEQ